MTLPSAPSLCLPYAVFAELAENVARQTRIREIDDHASVLKGMGARIEIQTAAQWSDPLALSVEARGPADFSVALRAASDLDNKVSLSCALAHYLLHAKQGQQPARFFRFSKERYNLEALWFALSLLIPDRLFALAHAKARSPDQALADLFRIPKDVIAIKRKVMTAQGLLLPA